MTGSPEIEMTQHVTTVYTISVPRKALIEGTLHEYKIPSDARVEIHVPGGGDYSNMSLPYEDGMLTISWTREEYS